MTDTATPDQGDDLADRQRRAIAHALDDMLEGLERTHMAVLNVDRGLATGPPGQGIVRLTIDDVAGIAVQAIRDLEDA